MRLKAQQDEGARSWSGEGFCPFRIVCNIDSTMVPTIRDVAQRAEVHPGTASRALNEATRSLVKAETAERVMAAAAELGYKPNYLARSFKTRRTFSVGVVIPDINNPLFPPIVRGLEERLSTAGYVALLANTDNDIRAREPHPRGLTWPPDRWASTGHCTAPRSR